MIQTTNIRRIVDRLMRNNPMMRDLPFESAVEYAADFIELVGAPALYEEKTAFIDIKGWRGELPCDFYKMIQVRSTFRKVDGACTHHDHHDHHDYTGHHDLSSDGVEVMLPEGFFPEREGFCHDGELMRDDDHHHGHHHHMHDHGVTEVHDHRRCQFHPVVYRYSADSFHMSPDKPDGSRFGLYTYKLQGNCIFTSTKDQDLEISYMAYCVDDEGLPLIPDNVEFLRGLELYIKQQWYGPKFDEGKISQAVMERLDREYAWAVGAAQSEFARLDLDKAETLFNAINTLLPRRRQHMIGYASMGAKENWHTH